MFLFAVATTTKILSGRRLKGRADKFTNLSALSLSFLAETECYSFKIHNDLYLDIKGCNITASEPNPKDLEVAPIIESLLMKEGWSLLEW